jgi:hypothetical protein
MLLTFFTPLLLGHCVAYFALFRHLRAFRNEKVILLYHVACFIVVAGVFAIRCAWLPTYGSLLDLVLVVGAHGIYSLSTLELWTLAEGGYSLSILIEYESARKKNVAPDFDKFTMIGANKKVDRITVLEKLRLLQQSGTRVALTSLGTVVATVLGSIAWLANVQEGG